MPIIGSVTGGIDFSNYFLPLSSKVTAPVLADAKKQGAVLAWGNFITLAINFPDHRLRFVPGGQGHQQDEDGGAARAAAGTVR